MVNFGAIARNQRQKLGWSQQTVADKALCHRETVWAFENNDRRIGLDIAQDIFKVLGLELIVREAKHDD